ncbi:MAG: ABC transporter permease [Dehalococcoidales bacterium]|nr:MAG: ABC transporter permease [Dehalococcoidales bacterium]
MSWPIIRALVTKDLRLFFRNRFFAYISVAGIAFYIGIYFFMPSSVDEALDIGLYAPVLPPVFEQVQGEGLLIETVDSIEILEEGVTEGLYLAGIVLPPDIMEKLAAGNKVTVDVYFASDTPQELKDAVTNLIQELAYLQSGQILAVDISEEIIGPDMLGRQIPPRNRILPFFAVFIILTETLGLSSLISEEIENRTAQALLITPMTVKGLFLAKGVTGVSLAFSQALLFMIATGGLNQQPLIILVTLLLASLLVTGIGFLLGSAGKDLMSVMAWGLPAMIVLAVPAFGVMFPGTVSDWVKVIPSYYLVDTVHLSANFGLGWGDVWQNLLILVGFDIAFFGLGIIALRRKLT